MEPDCSTKYISYCREFLSGNVLFSFLFVQINLYTLSSQYLACPMKAYYQKGNDIGFRTIQQPISGRHFALESSSTVL